MEEPQRIGLTAQANAYLDGMLDSLNSETDAPDLIKFDLYRLAVALGVKKGITPEPLSDKTDNAFRVGELDPDKALFFAVDAANLQEPGKSIYRTVEALGEQGIRHFYDTYRENMDKLHWDKLLT